MGEHGDFDVVLSDPLDPAHAARILAGAFDVIVDDGSGSDIPAA